jgi:hypothetical protein
MFYRDSLNFEYLFVLFESERRFDDRQVVEDNDVVVTDVHRPVTDSGKFT